MAAKKKKKRKNKNLDKKALVLMIVSVSLLVVLVVSASYAYFMVTGENNSGTTKLNVGVEGVGGVSFQSTNRTLKMNLTNMQMIQLGKDTEYYGSNTGVTTTPTNEELGFIEVNGEGAYDCDYELEVKATSTSEDTNMYTKFQGMSGKSEEQIIFSITTSEGTTKYDFNKSNLFPIVYKGNVKNLVEGQNESIKAQLKFVNKTGVVQDALENANITMTISIKTFKCEPSLGE